MHHRRGPRVHHPRARVGAGLGSRGLPAVRGRRPRPLSTCAKPARTSPRSACSSASTPPRPSGADGSALDGAAGRVADWVDDSCGAFPMVAFVSDLFAAARRAEGDELVFEFPGDR